MSAPDNIYKYITTEGKIFGEKARRFTMLEYLQKSTGVFNASGMLSKAQVKEMKKRAQTGDKNIWHGFISFDEEHSEQIDHPVKCIELVKQTFNEFFKDAGFDPSNMDLICALHLDKPKHLHIHYVFWEKEPKIKNKRAAGYKYRAKGKIQMSAIDKMTERLNGYTVPDNIATISREAVKRLRYDTEYNRVYALDIVDRQLKMLAERMPKNKVLYYANKETEQYRYLIDDVVENIISTDPVLQQKVGQFYTELNEKKDKLQKIMSNYYKQRLKAEQQTMTDEPTQENTLPTIHTIEKLEWDFKRRMGNEVLRAVRYMQNNTYRYNTKIKHKTNDKNIKRNLAISNRKIQRYLTSFLGSIADIFDNQTNTYSQRLNEIEQEETDAEQQEAEEQTERQKYNNWYK